MKAAAKAKAAANKSQPLNVRMPEVCLKTTLTKVLKPSSEMRAGPHEAED